MRSTGWHALICATLLIGCGERGYLAKRDALHDKAVNQATAPSAMGEARVAVDAAPAAESPAPSPGRGPERAASDPTAMPAMIIRTGNASVEVDSLELAVARVTQLADRLGGYIANSQLQAGANQLRSATLEIKVPAARFSELTGGLAPLGRVEYVNVQAQDVGEEFTDIAARVANAHRLEQRLIDLLATRTGKLSDVLQIERELARVREEIERMEGRLRFLKAHVATSTLSVTVHEKAPLVGQVGSGSVIGEAFRQAWRNFVNFTAAFIESLGVILPVGALVLVALLGLRRLWRSRRAAAD